MPLTKRQFELGIYDETESLKLMIYVILSQQRHLAYSKAELLEMFSGNAESRIDDVLRALEALADTGAVAVKDIGGEDYYAFNQEVDPDTWEPR